MARSKETNYTDGVMQPDVLSFGSGFSAVTLDGSGVLAYEQTLTLANSASGTSDTLTRITGGEIGDSIVLRAVNGHTITVDSGSAYFALDNDVELSGNDLLLLWCIDGDVWGDTLNGAGSGGGGGGTDELAKVSANDTTAGYLNGKLVAGSGITLTENNDAGNETLTIAATGAGSTYSGARVYNSSNVSVPGTLALQTLTWDTEHHDTDSYHSGSAQFLLVPATGYYEAVLNLYCYGFNGYLDAQIMYYNGSTSVNVAGATVQLQNTSTDSLPSIVTGPIYMSAGNGFWARCRASDAGGLKGGSAPHSHFSIKYLGS